MTGREGEERPTVRRVLGSTLRRHREQAQLSLRELATKTTYNHTYIGRVERGEQLPSDALAQSLDDVLGTGGALFELLEVAREGAIQDYGRTLIHREFSAARIQVFTSSVVPGLLQTPSYARALFDASRLRKSDADLDDAVVARVGRQRIFAREEPPFFWAIMDEAALRRPVGSGDCMREQLTYVAEAARSPHVSCQIFPFGAGVHPMLGGSLTLLTMNDGEAVGHLESFGSGELVESPKRIIELTELFDTVRAGALPQEESLSLIRKYAEEDYR